MIIREAGLEAITGKKIGDIITDETKILTEFMDNYEVRDQILREHHLSMESYEDISVLTDLGNHLVICFKDGQPVCLFHVYDVSEVSLSGKRGVVTAVGHETVHEYWFDDGEYNKRYTR